MSDWGRRRAAGLFLLFLVAFVFWGARNYRCQVYSDPSTYLRFAESLAAGDFFIDNPPDKVFTGRYPPEAIHFGTYATMIYHGRGIAFYAIGFPLYLAAWIALGGRYAPFFANIAAFAALLLLLRSVTGRLFAGHAAVRSAAALAPALYWIFNRETISYLLAPYRDPLSYVFLLAALQAFLVYRQDGRRQSWLLASGLCLGFSVAIRETSLLALVPAGLFAASGVVHERRLPGARTLATFALGAVLGVSPTLFQNYLNSGNPLYPTQLLHAQVYFKDLEDMREEKSLQLKSLSVANFKSTAPRVVDIMLKGYQGFFLALLVLGIWAGRGLPAVRWLLLPFIGLYALFYGFYWRPMFRYIFVAQLAITPLLALAAAEAASRLGRWLRKAWLPAATALGVGAGAVLLMVVEEQPDLFQRPQAEEFRRDFETWVPAGAIVLAERPMQRVIDYFTNAHGIKLDEVVREEVGLSLAEGMAFFRRSFPGVFYFDSADLAQKKKFDQSPVTRETILSRFDLTPVATFDAAVYRLAGEFGRPRAALSRIDEWSGKEVTGTVAVPAGRGGWLRLNARGVSGATGPLAAEISIDGRRVGHSLAGGLNWYPLPDLPSVERTAALRVAAPVSLPRDMDPTCYAPDDPIPMDVGPNAVPFDTNFLSPEFFRAAPYPGERSLEGEGRVRVPALPLADSTQLLSARIRGFSAQPEATGRASFTSLDGPAVFAYDGSGAWTTVSVPLPVRNGTQALLDVGISGSAALPLRVGRFTVLRLRHDREVTLLDFGGDDLPYLAQGFYDSESYQGHESVRWTNGEARVHLPASSEARRGDREVRLRLFGPPAAVSRPHVRITFNGVALGTPPLQSEVVQEVTVTIPAKLWRPGLNELGISSTAWRPAKLLDSPDTRTLGLMLDTLELRAVAR